MTNVTGEYVSRAEIWLFITTLLYFTMNGAQLFETAVIVPKWTASPPESFQLFRGQYGLDFKVFWIVFHSIHEITFVLALMFCWRLDFIRSWLLVLFVIHLAVRVWTLLYFAPNIIEFQKMANATEYGTQLLQRVTSWKNLNYIRVGLFMAVSIGLLPVCVKLLHFKSLNFSE